MAQDPSGAHDRVVFGNDSLPGAYLSDPTLGKNFSRPAKSRTHIPLFLLPGIPLRSMPGYFQNVPSGL
jgi:hypothetical protein